MAIKAVIKVEWYNRISLSKSTMGYLFISKSDYSMTEQPMTQGDNRLSLSAQIEALLFVAPGSVSISQLSIALEVDNHSIEKELKILEGKYSNRGVRLQRHRNRVQLVTAPEAALVVELFLGLEATTHLSQAALETLSIIAYRQPVTRPQIDSIRGVNSDGVMKTLLTKGLIQEVGRSGSPGRPFLFSTTPDFLGYFGLTSLEELPPLNPESTDQNDPSENDTLLKD
jgi:segregation and condensation protein B